MPKNGNGFGMLPEGRADRYGFIITIGEKEVEGSVPLLPIPNSLSADTRYGIDNQSVH